MRAFVGSSGLSKPRQKTSKAAFRAASTWPQAKNMWWTSIFQFFSQDFTWQDSMLHDAGVCARRFLNSAFLRIKLNKIKLYRAELHLVKRLWRKRPRRPSAELSAALLPGLRQLQVKDPHCLCLWLGGRRTGSGARRKRYLVVNEVLFDSSALKLSEMTQKWQPW